MKKLPNKNYRKHCFNCKMSAQKKNMQVFFAKLLINLVSQSAFYAETLPETIESGLYVLQTYFRISP